MATILATAVTALFFAVEYSRQRAVIAPLGEPTRWIDNLLVIVFILFVAFLGFYGLTAVEGSRGLNATIFPEPMSMFTLRAFGSFYLAISIAAIPLLFARGRKNVLSHGYALYGLLVFITIATAVFIGHFDFAGRPTQLIYPGVYVTVAIVVGFYLLRYGTGSAEQQSTASPAAQK